jgi:hypothetical protein
MAQILVKDAFWDAQFGFFQNWKIFKFSLENPEIYT